MSIVKRQNAQQQEDNIRYKTNLKTMQSIIVEKLKQFYQSLTCNLECPVDEVYDFCGSVCEPTCYNPDAIEDCANDTCVEGDNIIKKSTGKKLNH